MRPFLLALAALTSLSAQDLPARVGALAADIDAILRKHKVPGAGVAVFRDFEIEWARGFGLANAATKQPVDALTLFQAASISKPVAALAAMRLAEDRRLDLDGNVNTYLKSWKLPENDFTRATPVNLRHLLSHTGGLTIHGFPGYPAGAPLPTVAQVLDGAPPANTKEVRVAYAPNTKFEYSGGGYTILQLLLTDQTGLPFPELMRALVLDRLAMRSSTYQQPLPERLLPFATAGHEKGAVVAGERHVYPEMAAAGLWTTPSDLARFALAIQRARLGLPGAVLARELARQMTTEYLPGSFGLGFELLLPSDKPKRFFGHTGGNKGFRCILLASLDGGHGVVVMTNGDVFDAVSEIARKILAGYGW